MIRTSPRQINNRDDFIRVFLRFKGAADIHFSFARVWPLPHSFCAAVLERIKLVVAHFRTAEMHI